MDSFEKSNLIQESTHVRNFSNIDSFSKSKFISVEIITERRRSLRATRGTPVMYVKIAPDYPCTFKITPGLPHRTRTRKKRKRCLRHSRVAKERMHRYDLLFSMFGFSLECTLSSLCFKQILHLRVQF